MSNFTFICLKVFRENCHQKKIEKKMKFAILIFLIGLVAVNAYPAADSSSEELTGGKRPDTMKMSKIYAYYSEARDVGSKLIEMINMIVNSDLDCLKEKLMLNEKDQKPIKKGDIVETFAAGLFVCIQDKRHFVDVVFDVIEKSDIDDFNELGWNTKVNLTKYALSELDKNSPLLNGFDAAEYENEMDQSELKLLNEGFTEVVFEILEFYDVKKYTTDEIKINLLRLYITLFDDSLDQEVINSEKNKVKDFIADAYPTFTNAVLQKVFNK